MRLGEFSFMHSEKGSEGVAHTKVEAESLPEVWYIVVPSFGSGIRHMYRYAHIDSQKKYAQIIPQPESCAKSHIAPQGIVTKLGTRASVIGTQQPHITGIGKQRTAELPHKGEAPLHICLELEVASMVDVGITPLRVIAPRTNAA